MEPGKKDRSTYFGIRQDVVAWSVGIAFIVAIDASILGVGYMRDWDAQSGFKHNVSKTSRYRFLPEPNGDDSEIGVPGRYGPGASSRWYYWQLPPEKANALTRGVVWTCYVVHQLAIWASIYVTQKMKSRGGSGQRKYSTAMTRYQWIPLLINVAFHFIHLAQTHWTYDGLAQDVSVASSQSCFIMLLVFVLLMEYRDRGLFFGWPSIHHKDKISKTIRFHQGPINLLRKYHGYVFAWSTIYTFWYHPMENTWGHCMGFVHTWLLMLQGSLMYTDLHLNRYWRLILESWVTLHSTVVAVQTGGPGLHLWPMFFFGFLWLFFMTQLFGLTFWKKLPSWTRPIPFIVYLAVTIGLYGFHFVDNKGRHWIRLNEPIRIPFIEYLAVCWAWVCIWFFMKLEKRGRRRYSGDEEVPGPGKSNTEVVYIFFVLVVYALMIVLSYLVQELDLKSGNLTLMSILVLAFVLMASISLLPLQVVMKPETVPNNVVSPSPKGAQSTDEGEVNKACKVDDSPC
ncbi:hypothetical protein HOLleu_31593 [Holothuria leucospilota]|uniref:Uncharacterized protein n=1 Tax=Holothuria leucospilota TaxID=206669 RepID=A0A9Q0YSC3_HOLLE|nr:hypothetical protein HOLleu_31593 [Holothuria leucospilota]